MAHFPVSAFLVAARHEKIKGLDVENVLRMEITMSKPMVLHADGEYLGDVAQASFECLHHKLILLQ